MSAPATPRFEPELLPWAQLRASLPLAIELPDPEGGSDGDGGLYKRIDHLSLAELHQHLEARSSELRLELEEFRLLCELQQHAIAAGCEGNAPVLAAIERSAALDAPHPHPALASFGAP